MRFLKTAWAAGVVVPMSMGSSFANDVKIGFIEKSDHQFQDGVTPRRG